MSASDPMFEEHKALVAQLRAGTLDAPDHLHRRVLAGGPAKRRRWAELSRGRRALLVVPVAAVLAVGAALVHGAFNSGSKPTLAGAPAHLAALSVGNTPAHTAPRVPARQKSGRDFATLAQSKPATSGEKAVTYGESLYSPDAVTIPKNRLVHADASLQVVVRNHDALSHATNEATQIVTRLGGYAQNVQFQASRNGDGNAYLELRVPVGRAEAAIGKLSALGRLVSQSVSTQDLQQQFSKQTDTIGSLQRAIGIYEQALQNGSLSGSQRVIVEVRLENAEHQLTQLRKARSQTVASASTADIQLTLTTNQHAFVTPAGKSGRLGRLLGNAADFLGLEGIIVLYILIVAGPILLLVALGWGLVRERRRRDERRLLASA